MKKQFIRVKQLADQTFSRSGKSEVLTDELQAADRKVEQLRTILQALCKRLAPATGGGSIAQSQDPAAREKRLRKLPEYMLGLSMHEASNFDDENMLKYVMQECAKTEIALANEIADHETKVEQLVLAPLNTVTDQELPALLKAKKQLNKLISEKESAAHRYQYLIRTGETAASISSNSHSATSSGTKLSAARDELDDAAARAEQARDALAADMFALIVRETELANTILQYVKLQRAYHESALHALQEIVPSLEKFIHDSSVKPMFGYPLEEHLRVTGRTIAYPIELCVCALHELGFGEEGLFRVAGGLSRVRRMKLSLDSGMFSTPLPKEYRDVHVIAAVLKSYLRELPEPLVPRLVHADILAASGRGGGAPLKEILSKLPSTRYANLRYLVKFLAALTKNQAVNKMTPFNLAVVIAPNLLWFDMNTTAAVNHAVELLIADADYYFGEDINFFTTFTKEDLLPFLYEYGFTPAFIQSSQANLDQPNGEHNMSKSMLEYSTPNAPKIISTFTQGRHSRSNSHDTSLILIDDSIKRAQSNSSLSDQSSPPHGSPKPIRRRKNKPIAPTPPNFTPPDKGIPTNVRKENLETKDNNNKVETEVKPDKPPRPTGPDITRVVSGVQTINRSTYKNKQGTKPIENITGSRENLSDIRRNCTDFDHEEGTNASMKPPPIPVITTHSVAAQTGSAKSKVIAETHQTVPQTKNAINAKSGFLPTKQHVSVQNRPVPVAAPRTTITQNTPKAVASNNKLDSIAFIDAESNTEVQLRAKPISPDVLLKPAIPERPATLRPQSFRNSIHKISTLEITGDINQGSNGVNSPSTPTVLERTHVYSVDKQQPTVIQVGIQSPNKIENDTLLEESNKVFIQRTHSSGASSQKSEKQDALIDDPKSFSSQTRKLSQSEGNILDVPASPRSLNRPPRPQGPAPPPPATASIIAQTNIVPCTVIPTAVTETPASISMVSPTLIPRPKSDGAESTNL